MTHPESPLEEFLKRGILTESPLGVVTMASPKRGWGPCWLGPASIPAQAGRQAEGYGLVCSSTTWEHGVDGCTHIVSIGWVVGGGEGFPVFSHVCGETEGYLLTLNLGVEEGV